MIQDSSLHPALRSICAWIGPVLLATSASAQVDTIEVQRLTATAPTLLGNFGTHIDLDGDTLVVGEQNYSIFPEMSGNASVWTRDGEDWAWQADLEPSVPQDLDYFGADPETGHELARVTQLGHKGAIVHEAVKAAAEG